MLLYPLLYNILYLENKETEIFKWKGKHETFWNHKTLNLDRPCWGHFLHFPPIFFSCRSNGRSKKKPTLKAGPSGSWVNLRAISKGSERRSYDLCVIRVNADPMDLGEELIGGKNYYGAGLDPEWVKWDVLWRAVECNCEPGELNEFASNFGRSLEDLLELGEKLRGVYRNLGLEGSGKELLRDWIGSRLNGMENSLACCWM